MQQNSGERGHSLSPQNYAVKAKVINAAADEVPERDTNGAEYIKEPNLETASGKEIRGNFSFVNTLGLLDLPLKRRSKQSLRLSVALFELNRAI